MTKESFDQYVFPRLHDEKGNGKGYGLSLRGKTPEQRKIVEMRYARALGFKINNPNATDYQIAKHLRETKAWLTTQKTAEAAVGRWKKLAHWTNELKARGIPT